MMTSPTSSIWVVDFKHYPSVIVCSSKVLALSYVAEQTNSATIVSKREYNRGTLVEITYKMELGGRREVTVYSTTVDPHVRRKGRQS